MGEQQKSNQTEQDLNHVLKARRDKLAELQAAGKDPFQITKYDVTAHSMDIKEHYEEWEGKEVSIAGRLMFKRVRVRLLSATFRILREISRFMWQETASVKMHIKILRRWISVIS
mgnify:CR=1 FL=1